MENNKLPIISFEGSKLLNKIDYNLNLCSNNYSEENNYELGFNVYTEKDLRDYNIYPAPYLHELQQWFRVVHDIHLNVNTRYSKPNKEVSRLELRYAYEISTKDNKYGGLDDNLDMWLGFTQKSKLDLSFHVCDTYDEALECAIVEGIKIVQGREKLL